MTFREDDLLRRLRATLTQPATGDVVFGPGERELARQQLEKRGFLPGQAGVEALKPAAVLVPLVLRPEGTTILLTERTAHLADHAGQISFPGGRFEPEDVDAVDAALRETEEEIGLARAHVEILGCFEDYGTVTGYRVTPVIGLARPPFDLVPDPVEVAEVFELPLEFILDPSNISRAREMRGGFERDVYEVAYGKWRVWGFTARILVRLIAALEDGAVTQEGR